MPLFSMLGDVMPVASLSPLLWPAYPLDPLEDNVLVLLNSNAPEECEYPDDAVEALEGSRCTEDE
jgi:hypothetical protein